jgi:hypothetical protein
MVLMVTPLTPFSIQKVCKHILPHDFHPDLHAF